MTASEVKSLPHCGPGSPGSSQRVSAQSCLTSETDMGLKAKLLSHSYQHTSSLGKGSVSQSVGRFLEHFIILGSHNVCLNSGWPQAAFQTGTIHQDVQTDHLRVRKNETRDGFESLITERPTQVVKEPCTPRESTLQGSCQIHKEENQKRWDGGIGKLWNYRDSPEFRPHPPPAFTRCVILLNYLPPWALISLSVL